MLTFYKKLNFNETFKILHLVLNQFLVINTALLICTWIGLVSRNKGVDFPFLHRFSSFSYSLRFQFYVDNYEVFNRFLLSHNFLMMAALIKRLLKELLFK